MTSFIISNREPNNMGRIPPEYLYCDKPAKHSIVYKQTGVLQHGKMVIRMCDYHFHHFKEESDKQEGDALITLPFIKYRENQL